MANNVSSSVGKITDDLYDRYMKLLDGAASEEEADILIEQWAEETNKAIMQEILAEDEGLLFDPLEISNLPIKGIDYRDDAFILLGEYSFEVPVGTWKGRLDDRMWGRSCNLLLFFSEASTGEKYALSVFSNRDYSPNKGVVNFREQGVGKFYNLTTDLTKTNRTAFVKAEGPL